MVVKEIYTSGRKRKVPERICTFCGESFFRHQSRSKKSFCSNKCSSQYRSAEAKANYPTYTCTTCGTEFKRAKAREQNSKHGLYFCSRKCKDLGQSLATPNDDTKVLFPEHYGNAVKGYRKQTRRLQEFKCVGCEEQRSFLLTVHHIDGNHKNNNQDNLETVCYRCHVLRHLTQQPSGEWVVQWSQITDRAQVAFFDAETRRNNCGMLSQISVQV